MTLRFRATTVDFGLAVGRWFDPWHCYFLHTFFFLLHVCNRCLFHPPIYVLGPSELITAHVPYMRDNDQFIAIAQCLGLEHNYALKDQRNTCIRVMYCIYMYVRKCNVYVLCAGIGRGGAMDTALVGYAYFDEEEGTITGLRVEFATDNSTVFWPGEQVVLLTHTYVFVLELAGELH